MSQFGLRLLTHRNVTKGYDPFVTLVAGIVANTSLGPIFIFAFGWGVAGAAVSTVCGQLLSTVLVFRYLFFR